MKRGEGMFRMTCIALAVLLAPTLASSADDPPPEGWQITADLGLNFNQSSYSDSWKGGEQAAISWTLSANGVAEKQMSPKANWRNTLKLSFGQTHLQEEDLPARPLSGEPSLESSLTVDVSADLVDVVALPHSYLRRHEGRPGFC